MKHYLPQAGLLVIGTRPGVAFSSIALYTEIKEGLATNEAKIDANRAQTDRLMGGSQDFRRCHWLRRMTT